MYLKRRLLIFLGIITCLNRMASAEPISIELTTDALGFGSTKINYAKNDKPIEADRPGKLVTSTAANVGSILYVQTDNLAGSGTLSAPFLVAITARSHLSVQDNLPAGYDLHAGAITISNDSGTLENDGLGVRAFGIDTRDTIDISGTVEDNPNFGKRYVNPAYVVTNVTGFQMEGSKEISGGFDVTDFNDFVTGEVPNNSPPHVDEDVTFDFNDSELLVAADSIRVLLTRIKAGSDNDPLDLAIDLKINLVGGSIIDNSYDFLSDAPDLFIPVEGETKVVQIDFSAASLGLSSTDLIASFVIGAREDPADGPKETDEHFLINGFSVIASAVPEPSSFVLLGIGCVALLGYGFQCRKKELVA